MVEDHGSRQPGSEQAELQKQHRSNKETMEVERAEKEVGARLERGRRERAGTSLWAGSGSCRSFRTKDLRVLTVSSKGLGLELSKAKDSWLSGLY